MRTCPFAATLLLVLLGLTACTTPPTGGEPLYDIPRLSHIAIDGRATDWGEQGFRIDAFAWRDNQVRSAGNLDPRFRLAWDDRGLLVLATVRDDAAVEAGDDQPVYLGDSVGVYYSGDRTGRESSEGMVSPGREPGRTPRIFSRGGTVGLPGTGGRPTAFTHGQTHDAHGYVVEFLIPWENFGLQPAPGREIAVQLLCTDSDARGSRHQAIWYPEFGASADNRLTRRVRLSDRASPPVALAAVGRAIKSHGVEIEVTGQADLVGTSVALRDGGQEVAHAVLQARDGHSFGRLYCSIPLVGRFQNSQRMPPIVPAQQLDLAIAGRSVAPVNVNPAQMQARAFIEAGLSFHPAVFSGTAFPQCDFDQPALAENLIGPYTIDVTFYGPNFHPVTTAANPGRYGAVVRIKTDDGRTFTRFRTLFRTVDELAPWNWQIAGQFELPRQLGIDPALLAEQHQSVCTMVRNALETQNRHSDDIAVLLAGLYERAKAQGPASVFDDPRALDRQWWVTLKRRLNGNAERYTQPLVCPQPITGAPAPTLRPGTPAEAGMTPAGVAKIDTLLTEWAANSDEAFIACIARHGVIVLHKAYGTRDGKPMTTDTKSWMASTTKFLQGTCLMMLVDQGRLDLDARVDQYLPEFRNIPVRKPMTVRHLPPHAAGMWGHWGDDLHDFEHLVAEYYPYLRVGEKLDYNGMDLALASKIIEQLSGEALPAFYQKHLLGPLGCQNTAVTNSSYDAASTALDMARVAQMLLNRGTYGNHQFFSPATLEKMLPKNVSPLLGRPSTAEWGVGCIWMDTDILGPGTFGHGAASSATFRVVPAHDLVITMTRNTAGKNFNTYHPKFLQAVIDARVEDPVKK